MGAWEEAAAGSPGSKTVIKHLRLGAERAQRDGRVPRSLKPFFFSFWTSCGLSIAVSFAALGSRQKGLREPTQRGFWGAHPQPHKPIVPLAAPWTPSPNFSRCAKT